MTFLETSAFDSSKLELVFRIFITKFHESKAGLVLFEERRKRSIELAMRVVVKPEPAAKT